MGCADARAALVQCMSRGARYGEVLSTSALESASAASNAWMPVRYSMRCDVGVVNWAP